LWRATIQVSTASHESLGMATLEAMYTENCCVLPRLGSYPALCGDHPEVLYEPGDETELVRRVVEFCKDDARRRHIATQLSDRARHYRGARVVDAVVDVIGEVLT
jgi:glycosyltransferase involved in cell wall biosynthesis